MSLLLFAIGIGLVVLLASNGSRRRDLPQRSVDSSTDSPVGDTTAGYNPIPDASDSCDTADADSSSADCDAGDGGGDGGGE